MNKRGEEEINLQDVMCECECAVHSFVPIRGFVSLLTPSSPFANSNSINLQHNLANTICHHTILGSYCNTVIVS